MFTVFPPRVPEEARGVTGVPGMLGVMPETGNPIMNPPGLGVPEVIVLIGVPGLRTETELVPVIVRPGKGTPGLSPMSAGPIAAFAAAEVPAASPELICLTILPLDTTGTIGWPIMLLLVILMLMVVAVVVNTWFTAEDAGVDNTGADVMSVTAEAACVVTVPDLGNRSFGTSMTWF